MYIPRFGLYLVCLLLSSCLYNSDEDDNFRVINPDVQVVPVQIDLDLAGDTVEVFNVSSFRYDISGYDPSNYYSIVLLTENESISQQGFSGAITYFPKIDSGYVTVTLRVATRSGTLSLADRTGHEHIFYERSWVLKVYTREPKPVKITSIAPSEGSLKVSWPKYDKINFKQYNVLRKRNYFTEWVKTITDPDSAFYIDHDYVGGDISYQVILLSKSGHAAQGLVADFTDKVPELVHVDYAPESQMKVYWSATRYPINLKRYEVYAGGYGGSADNLIYSTTDPRDTAFTFLPPFGQPAYITIKSFGTLAQYDAEVVYSSKEYVFGERIEPFQHIYFASLINRYFTIHGDRLRAFTLDGNQLIAETQFSFSTSPPPVILSSDNTELLTIHGGNTIISWDTQTLQLIEQTALSSLLATGEYFAGLGLASNNTLLLNKQTGTNVGNLLFYNRNTHTVEQEYTGVGVHRYYEVYEKDNDYLIARGNLSTSVIKLGAGNVATSVHAASSEEGFFDPENDYQVIIGSYQPNAQGSIFHWDFKNSIPISQPATPLMQTLDMDVASSHIVGYIGDGGGVEAIVYDYKNQTTIMRCSKLIGHGLQLNESYLYSAAGVRLKLPR